MRHAEAVQLHNGDEVRARKRIFRVVSNHTEEATVEATDTQSGAYQILAYRELD